MILGTFDYYIKWENFPDFIIIQINVKHVNHKNHR